MMLLLHLVVEKVPILSFSVTLKIKTNFDILKFILGSEAWGIKTGYLVFQGKALNTFPLFF